MDDSYISVRGNEQPPLEVAARENGVVSEDALRRAFLLKQDVPVGLFCNSRALDVCRDGDQFVFVLGTEWKGKEFELKWDETRHSRPSTSMEDNLPTIDRCRKYMLFSLITEVTPGVFEDGEIKNCVTVASSRFAFMAGHCLPKSFPKGKMFKVYDFSGNSYDVRLVLMERYEDSGDDFAVVEVQNGQFTNFPSTVGSPYQGAPYFILGYDGEYPYAELSYFAGMIRNINIYPSQNYIIGSPGTTSGCSGGGVFSMNGDLYGICVSGRIDSSNNLVTIDSHLQTLRRKLDESSYSHIIPGHYLMANLPNRKRKREEIDTSGSSDDSMDAAKE